MLAEIFYWVLNMSITAIFTGMIVLLLRQIKKIPRRFIYYIWVIPFFRMMLPLGLSSRFSFMSLLSGITTKTIEVFKLSGDVSFSMMNSVRLADTYFPITYKSAGVQKIFQVASGIWIVVALALLFMLIALYRLTMKEMKDAVPLRDNIFLSEKIQSPAVYGIIKPRIILPTSYENKNIDYILMHEKMHIRRGDNLLRMLVFFIVAVHWFNPLAWVFINKFLGDVEVSCDECVIAKCNETQIKEYALSLLECKEKNNLFVSAFGGAKIRTRIENIVSFRKMTFFSAIMFLGFFLVVFFILLTNAK